MRFAGGPGSLHERAVTRRKGGGGTACDTGTMPETRPTPAIVIIGHEHRDAMAEELRKRYAAGKA